MSKKLSLIALSATLTLGLAACAGGGAGESTEEASGGGSAAPEDTTIGVSMPTQTSERWIADGDAVQSGLEEAGYEVDLQFANDDIPTQQQQLDSMITNGADVLIIAAIDGTAIGTQLDAAKAEGIPVISYDRLIRDSENVDFYVTFDNEEVGRQQATALLTGLGVKSDVTPEGTETGPFNIELFAGSLDDNNATFFFNGAMEVLQPLIDAGTLVVKSNQTDIDQVATLRWQTETAQRRMDDLLTSAYNDGSRVDGVLVPADVLSKGVLTSLQNAGYGTPEQPIPVVTGQDAEIAAVKSINDGIQSSTIFKDTRLLAEQAIIAAEAYLNDEEPEPNDTETYDNGVKVVPSYLLDSVIIFKDDIQTELVDTGYWTAEEVAAGQAS